MTDKFQNKYRIASARLQSWDYGSNAAYFVTICTAHRKHYFGEIANVPNPGVSVMQLSEIGAIAEKYWMEIPQHFPFVDLGAFVVMPNHVHGIIIINKTDDGDDVRDVETPKLGVSTHRNPITTRKPTNAHKTTAAASKKWKPATLGVIINQYKRAVTIDARKIHADFGWQSRYHDHIIRNDKSFRTISNYIVNNPANWKEDRFNR